MQIGPSLSLLQALGSQPGAPERVRLTPAANAQASAAQRQPDARAGPRWPERVEGSAQPAPTERAQPSAGARRVDILV